jgi:cobalt-zinc-cadmium efflux system outer membrane protein
VAGRRPLGLLAILGWALVAPSAAGAQPATPGAGPPAASPAGAATIAWTGPSVEVTVDEFVARALAGHPELRAARAEIDAAAGRLRQAGLRPNPMLDLGGQKALGPDNNLMAGLTIPLDLNGRREGRLGVAEGELAVRRAQLADRERRLRADVRLKTGEVLAARRNLEVTDELLAVNREALGLVRERVARGAVPALEEGLLLVEVNRLDASRELLAGRVEVPLLQLRALAGLPPETPLGLAGELTPAVPLLDRTAAMRRALAGRPDVEAARAETAAAQARVRKEEAEGRWDASLNLGYQRQDFGFDLRGLTASGGTRPIQDVFHYFGGGVTIMLPVRNRNEGSIAAAGAERRAAERRQDGVALTVAQEVAATLTQYEAARRALEIYERGVRDVARRNLEVVRGAYRLGRTTLLDVIAEQRRYVEVELGYTEAIRQVHDAAVEIERATGGPDR